jgi:hypothetical protein
MTQHRCEKCGAENAANAQFCTKCDFYLGWDTGVTKLDDAPLTMAIPVVRETHAATEKFRGADAAAPRKQNPPAISIRSTSPAVAPMVRLVEPEVTIDPVAGGTFGISVHNKSSIVDGYTVAALDAPRWLVLEHPTLRLQPAQEQRSTIRLTIPPNLARMVYVQRFRVRLQISSVANPAKRTGAELVVVVPRFGTPSTIAADPGFIRMQDATTGRFRVHLDNRNSNYPQRYGLRGHDPEGLVRFTFRPQMVEVAPQSVQSVEVHFEAPAPGPGSQVMRTLTVTAANNAAQLDTIVKVEHRSSAARSDDPVTLRLDPDVIRQTDQAEAQLTVLVDNRAGLSARRLHFFGRDPADQLRFGFAQQPLHVRAGELAQMRATISAPMPRPGERIERPFSIICSDGSLESEATGNFGLHASAQADSATQLRAFAPQPPPTAASPQGPPVWHGDQAAGAPASTSNDDVVASGRSASKIRPLLRWALTVFGGALVIAGAIRPWFSGGPTYAVNGLIELPQIIGLKPLDDAESISKLEQLTQPGVRALVLILAVALLLGLVPTSGRLTVIVGLLTAALMAGYVAFAMSALASTGPAYGSILVVSGGVIGAVGGLFPKRPKAPAVKA